MAGPSGSSYQGQFDHGRDGRRQFNEFGDEENPFWHVSRLFCSLPQRSHGVFPFHHPRDSVPDLDNLLNPSAKFVLPHCYNPGFVLIH